MPILIMTGFPPDTAVRDSGMVSGHGIRLTVLPVRELLLSAAVPGMSRRRERRFSTVRSVRSTRGPGCHIQRYIISRLHGVSTSAVCPSTTGSTVLPKNSFCWKALIPAAVVWCCFRVMLRSPFCTTETATYCILTDTSEVTCRYCRIFSRQHRPRIRETSITTGSPVAGRLFNMANAMVSAAAIPDC